MRTRFFSHILRNTTLFFVFVTVIFYGLWSSNSVSAFRDTKTVHIFPTIVRSVGFENPAHALRQELSEDAPFAQFTNENSASFHRVRVVPVTVSDVPETPVENTDSNETSSSTEPVSDIESPVTPLEVAVPPHEPVESMPITPEPVAEPETVTPVPETPSVPVVPVPEPTSFRTLFERGIDTLLSLSATTVFATTTEDIVIPRDTSTVSTLPQSVEQHIASCALVGTPCSVIELSGFGVEGHLKQERIREVRLSFSFAHNVLEQDLPDEKLRVRYLHNGQWRSAGDIFLNKELANGNNGGYFTRILDDVESWDDLESLVLSFEYETGEARTVYVYLDSAWIDVDYKELTGSQNDTQPSPDHVTFELETSGENEGHVLSISSSESIAFPFVDDMGEDTLIIRADKDAYGAQQYGSMNTLSSHVYVSVTNAGTTEDSFKLYAAFPDGLGSVKEIAQFLRNVPGIVEKPLYEDVTYFCDAGWTGVASSTDFMCMETGQKERCSSVNDSAQNCLVPHVYVGIESNKNYASTWVPMSATGPEIESMDNLPPGYKPGSVTEQSFTVLPQQTVYFRLTLDAPNTEAQKFVLQAQGESLFGDLDSMLLARERDIQAEESPSVVPKKSRINDRLSTRASFDGDELPEFRFKFKSQRSGIVKTFNRILGKQNKFAVDHAVLTHEKGDARDVPIDVIYGENGEWSLQLKKHPRAFRPGKYAMEIQITEAGKTYTDTVEFYWGVLAVNTNKTIYASGEVVDLHMGVIDDAGNTICNAITKLQVTTPEGVTEDLAVIESGKCGANNVTEVPDYSARYTTSVLGRYTISFSHFTSDGQLLHRISDFFEVRERSPFVVERTGPTRIYPKAPYNVTLRVTAHQDFEGTVTESVPKDTILTNLEGASLVQFGDTLQIQWEASLKEGETRTFSYTFDAPDISPYLYVFGPLVLEQDGTKSFEELRTWKVASDALGSYIEKASSWSAVTTGAWEAKDLSGSPFNVPANAVAEITIVNSDTANERTGGVRHASSSLTRSLLIHEAEPQGVTQTTMHVQVSATSSIQTFAEDANISFVLQGYWTDGYFVERFDQIDPGIANNTWGDINLNTYGAASGTVAEMVLGNWDTGLERNAGVRTDGSALSRLANIHESEANGVNTATMLVRASGTTARIEGFAQTEGANNASIDYWLSGYWSVKPTGLDYQERFDDLTGPGSASTWTDRTLSGFGVQSSGIAEVLFANAADANLSMLIGVRTDGSAIDRSRNLHEAEAGGWVVGRTHVKAGSDVSSTIEYFSDDTANDQFRLLGHWYASDVPPSAPTLHDVLFESEKTGTSTPKFNFTASDPDGTDSIIYQFQWDDDAVLDTAPLGDRTSDVETGCSPNCFTNTVTGGDTSPFNENEKIQFHIQTPLVSGTTYYWRVRALESGASIYSDWSAVQSFTYVADTDPSQWMQTQDTQFDQGTLSNTETFGSNAVRLSTTPPTGAMMVYGEGTVQTPRYRLWTGTAWGSENSAQSVGGTIQWSVVKAGTVRDEYILGTQDDVNDVNVQVYNGTSSTWAYLTEVTTGVADNTNRGFDIAVESTSGDAIVVYCDGDADPSYRIWNGSNWSSPAGTINLGSANNCEWVKLASDPVSDEIILVARDTGAQYEALVWDGTAWLTNTQVLGSMTDVAHEGIAVEYEESGDQALVVVSNGNTAGFTWTAWDGVAQTWNPPASQSLGNDFEAGALRQDVGTDRLGLCYSDEDDDMGSLIWDGDGWAIFVAATNEYETSGATNNRANSGTIEGHPFSCQFETTTGRDGYLMMSYSDNAAARYQFWNGSAHSGEASISTIQDAWSVYSARTGDGKILSAFHDDINGRFDVSSWDGSAWATAQTIENSPSVTAAPFREPITLAAQVYQAQTGTITSDVIDFDLVPSRPSWGEVLWNTTEAAGTDIKMQVYYESAGVCNVIVPDSAIPSNSTGFDATASPLDISSISTSTYNRICLKATLSTANASVPTLNDWSLSWERQPYLSQTHFSWYVNTNAVTPSDVWPSGAAGLAEDEAIPVVYAPNPNTVLRLRMALLNENVSLSSGALSLKLQYAQSSSCSASSPWQDVGAIGSTTAKWRGYDNAGVSDGATLASRVLTTTDVNATYEEQNDSTTNPNSASVNQELEYDWVLEHNADAGTNYCFRAITAQGEILNAYDLYPSLVTNAKPGTPVLDKLFDNEQTASTTPWFEFSAEDPESNDMTYEVQIDDDAAFASPNIDRDSQTNFTEFSNIITTSDKDPFTSGQVVRFVPTSALSNNTTYYWRVRAKDRNASNTWSEWSSSRSFTVDTGTTISTWFQTTLVQFATDNHEDTEATSTNDVVLTPPQTLGTTSASTIDFDWHTTGNAWGALSWTDTETLGIITYRLEYFTGTTWALIPDADLAGNAAGFNSPPVSLIGLDPTTYNQIRPRANLANVSGTPRLTSWTVTWASAVGQPTLTTLFDNEKTGTTTPTFTFSSDDPQSNDIIYQVSWSTDPTFAASTTRSSNLHAGFTSVASSTDTTPFEDNTSVRFKIQSGDVLSNNTTYYWRVRGRDPLGGDAWSVWSSRRSFTVDTTVAVSTWFQTTDTQFSGDTLDDTEVTGSGGVQITSIIREAFVAYAEGTVQAPRAKIWNGTAWGTELTGESVNASIQWIETAAAPTRDEYIVVTQNTTGRIDAQIYNGATGIWGNKIQIGTANSTTRRGFDVAYETSSGDAVAVACNGTEAAYRVWNGSAWDVSTTSITLAVTNNCEWVRLAADPVGSSNELIGVFRDTTLGAVDYNALVWSGSAWGNSTTTGSQATAANEGIAVEYEESGGDAVVVVGNTAASAISIKWNGSAWTSAGTIGLGSSFAGGRLARDAGSDEMGLCYIDGTTADLGYIEWSGSAWVGAFSEYEGLGNSANGRPVSCEYEVGGSRDNYLMIPYSDDTQAEYVFWNGTALSTLNTALSTVTDSWELRTTRTGDNNILMVAYDDANTEYDFSYWNGTSWSTEEVLETNSIVTTAPATVPLDLVSRRYPSFISGVVTSSVLDFDDGSGPKWDSILWTDITTGGSDILYQVEYFASTSEWALIPNTEIPLNSTGTTTSPIDLSNLSRTTYNQIRVKANLACGASCPTLSDWTVKWSEGIRVSGTAQQFDQSTNVTSGTVAVAVNGVLQTGKTAAISGGTWQITNVTAFEDDIITVFIDGAADDAEAAAVTKYDGTGDVTNIPLYERHLTIGSVDNKTVTNTNIGLFDFSNAGDEDIFFDVDAGNDLTVCATTGCFNSELYVKSGNTFRPDSASNGTVSTRHFENNGTTTADGNTLFVSGSWDNNGNFAKDTSTVTFTATSTTETIDSTGASAGTFNNVTLGQTSGTATWNLATLLDVDGALSIQYGTLNQNGNNRITIGGNLTIGASGAFTKGTASTTFDGTGTATWTDSTVAKQDMGDVVVNGTTKTVQLGAAAKLTDLTIGADDTFSVDNNYALEVRGNFTNNNSFLAQNGTVTFTATVPGNTITAGSSNFYSATFNGVGGAWSFTGSTLTLGNNFTIATGTVTMPTATTTIAGSFVNSGGTFMHNNGIVNLTAGSAKTITTNASAFYDLTFNGIGSWSFTESAATSSRHVTLTAGTVTMPSTLAVGGSFFKNGGSFAHNNGTLRFTASASQSLKFGNSDTYNMTFAGSGGTWSFLDAAATTTNTVRFESGTVTNPSGVWAVGGSWTATGGAFTHNSGTVKFNSSDTGETIAPGTSEFSTLRFENATGGWTLSSATSTSATVLASANTFTLTSGQSLAVLGTFTNAVGGSATTWTGSTLFLNSGTTYTLNTKTTGGDGYGALLVGANTDIKMWNSSSTVPTVNPTGSLYSQDHSAVDGALYVWGEYIPSGNEYWSYAADFDGTVLSGGSRRVADVRFASGATFAQSANALQILGDAGATTTITNQGSGTFGLAVSGGSVNAQYYSVRNINSTGFALTGTPTITTLSNGDMELAVNGGALMTVAGTVIDANPTLQILAGRFATTTAITGTNVTVTGTPSSYWWWRNTTGNFDGEAFDSDPAGDPGNARWDDSSFIITVAGTVYGDHGGTAIGTPCDGVTANVRVVVQGGGAYDGTCNASTGAYSIPNVAFIGDVVLTTFLNNASKRAVTVTKTPTTNISNMDLYENALIVRHEDTAALTIEDLAIYDSTNDTDLFFTAATSSTDTLTTQPNTELYVWSGKGFAPDGNVTLESGGSGSFRDGTLYLASSATFTASSTEAHSIGGGFTASTSALFTPAQSTVTFTATTSGKRIAATPTVSFYNLAFNGVGGGWDLLSTATTTVQNTFAVTQGTLSGTGDMLISAGDVTGSGSIAMTGGTVRLATSGSFGNSAPWQFYNLHLGSGSTDTSSKSGSGTTTVAGVLTVSAAQTFEAGSSPWVFTGGGTPLVVTGTFTVQTAPFYFTGTTATIIADETYNALTLAPSGAGSPTFTLRGGTLDASSLTIGDGTNPITVTANTNDPSISIGGNLRTNTSATFVASNVGALQVGGSWINNGTFTHSNGSLTFTSTDTGETVSPGTSPFYDLTFDGVGGGWTVLDHATSTRHTTITNATAFTVSPNKTLAVGGTFTNSVGGSATTWTDSVLFLNSGTSYSLNTKSAGDDTYGTLLVGPSTDIRSWNSSASTSTVDVTGSLYSQDHAAVDGSLYIWGDYVHASGSDYWSYATDFDGAALGGGSRQVNVRVASSSVLTFSGGVFDMIGVSAATTTIANQGAGRYTFGISGGTVNASYYSIRNTDAAGLSLSGTPTVTSLSRGDFELEYEGGSMMTVAGTVIDANPLKIIATNNFSTTTGITSGFNVRATGSSVSSWKFNLHYGNFDGESFDSDPAGDPGYLRWDDSASNITIQGNVYSDEGSTVSAVCDGSTPVVRLKVQGGGTFTSACAASPSGQYSISGVSFNPGDTLTVFLDTAGGVRAANVSVDPITNITDMHLYENRVIVRHEDTAPLTIADMSIYDIDDDSDIPFTATDAAPDTLLLPANTKLIVWDNKTFAPAGNITLASGGSGSAWDGSLELKGGAVLSLSGSQTHSVGGSFELGSGASMLPANSTITFTATTTGKTITPQLSDFYNVVFNGVGGNWAFSGGMASTSNDFTITNGTVTLPTGTTTIAGSFQNTGGTFMHNNGLVLMTSVASGKSVRANGSNFYNLTFNGSGGTWSFVDTNATSSRNFIISAGTVNLPAGTLAVGSSFTNTGSFAHSNGTVRLTSTASGNSIRAGGSNFYNLTQDGVGGAWTFTDTNATTTHSFIITNGSTTLPAGTLAVGGSFIAAGTFTHNTGTVKLTATTTGKTIQATTSPFYNLNLDSSVGGWTMTESATTTNALSITNANSFTLTSSKALAVGGTFTNSVGGAATTWTDSVLYLNSGTNFSANTKSVSGDSYATLLVGSTTDIRIWNSSSATTTVEPGGSLYSQDHAAVDGALNVWGDYGRSSGNDYWSYATDFDGTALGGGSRQVNVRVATSSTIAYSGTGSLAMVGTASATTTVRLYGSTGTYALSVAGSALTANYYQLRGLNSSGLAISGTPTIASLSNGDYELGVDGGAMLTVAGTTLDANASLSIASVAFGTSTGITSGYNVVRTGSPANSWTFTGSFGNYDGESFDSDGGDACGFIRWSDSSCLFVSQEHYRWRNDDGGGDVPNSEWYNASWSKRKKIGVTNPNATSYTNIAVKVVVDYDADMQSDFDDLRFTSSDGTTALSFWRERTTASASSTLWVLVPSLPSSGSATVYMYYGNGSAPAVDDGDTVFGFFDDFEDDNISEYSGNTSMFDVDTDFEYTGTYGLDAGINATNQTTSGIYRTGSLVARGDTLRFFQYVDASAEDEPCTYFGVQGSGSNYAVCLDQYPTEKVSIAENVTSNDGSGTIHASSTVTYTTGWYEVVINWLTSNLIDVYVYDSLGSLFVNVTTTDSSYSAGGIGFGYWGQTGGWDFMSSKPYTALTPTYVFGAEQGRDGATWKAVEDTALTGQVTGSNIRLRFSVQNTGAPLFTQQFRLQYASKGSSLNCESVPAVNFSDVPTTSGSCGSAAACMTTTSNFTDGASTAGLLSYPAHLYFDEGKLIEDPSNQTASSSVRVNAATEIEYNFQMTANATGNAYCFRTTNGGLALDNYARVPEVQILHTPTISGFTLNMLSNITLTEGATTTVIATGTVTDLNGYTDIVTASSSIYRSGVGASCSMDENNCYRQSSCSLSNCSGNSCDVICSADIQYFADPTDLGTYSGQNWLSELGVIDSTNQFATSSAPSVELLTLFGLSVNTASIDFDALAAGQNTGAVTEQTTVLNTGNSLIDINLLGTNLTGGASTIAVGEIKYATSTFSYASCSICSFLTGSATQVDVNIPKPTSSTTPSGDDLFWGINVPSGTAAVLHSGTNTFMATSP